MEQVDLTKYWYPHCEIDPTMSLEDAIDGTRHKLFKALD